MKTEDIISINVFLNIVIFHTKIKTLNKSILPLGGIPLVGNGLIKPPGPMNCRLSRSISLWNIRCNAYIAQLIERFSTIKQLLLGVTEKSEHFSIPGVYCQGKYKAGAG